MVKTDWFDFSCAHKHCSAIATKACGRCFCVRYCSASCQTQHWKAEHKTKCLDLKSARVLILRDLRLGVSSFHRVTSKVRDIRAAFKIFKKVEREILRPMHNLNPRLLTIEELLNSDVALGCDDAKADIESAKCNAYELADICLHISAFPYGLDTSPSVAVIERCIGLVKSCLEFLELLFRYGLVTIPTGLKELHDYNLLQARFLCEKGVFYFENKFYDDAIEYLESTIAKVNQIDTDEVSWGVYSRALQNLALVSIALNNLSRARSLLEDLYEQRCSKTGPGDVTLWNAVVLLADVYKRQGDHEESEYFLRFFQETVEKLSNHRRKDEMLIRMNFYRSQTLFERATGDSTKLNGKEERQRLLLEAETLAKEIVSLKNEGTSYMRKFMLQHLVDVMLERGTLDDHTLDEALTELINMLREVSNPGKTERLELGTALNSFVDLIMQRISRADRKLINGKNSHPSFSDSLMLGLKYSMQFDTAPDRFEELAAMLRCDLEILGICIINNAQELQDTHSGDTVATRPSSSDSGMDQGATMCELNNPSASLSHQQNIPSERHINKEVVEIKGIFSHNLHRLIQIAAKMMNIQLQNFASDSSSVVEPYDWMEILQVEESFTAADVPAVGDSRGDQREECAEKSRGPADINPSSAGKAPITHNTAVISESMLIRRAVVYWTVGQVLKFRLHFAAAEASSFALSTSEPVTSEYSIYSPVDDNVEADCDETYIAADGIAARKLDLISEIDDVPMLATSADEGYGGGWSIAPVTDSEIAALPMEIMRCLSLAYDILKPIDSVAGLSAILDSESATFDVMLSSSL